MTERLDRAIARVRTLPSETQDELAGLLLRLAGEVEPVYRLSLEEEASFANARDQAARRDFAPDEQIRAIWAKHGL